MVYGLPAFVFLCLLPVVGLAQTPGSSPTSPRLGGMVEVGGLVSDGPQTPFWLRTNQYGIVPLGGTAGTLRASLYRDYTPLPTPDNVPDSVAKKARRHFRWGFGVNAVANTGPADRANTNLHDARQVLWPEVFVKASFGRVELFAGRRREVHGLGDTTLTSGFYAWSGNAIPFPKIQLHTPGFVPVGWLRKAVAFRFGYAHGWFTQPNIQAALFHQKYLYLKFGKPTAKLSFTMGINHQVQWAGRADYLARTIYSVDGQLPNTLRDYVSVVLASYPGIVANDRFTEFDGTNRVGNHIGSIDFAFNWTDARRSWLLYHQHAYEDASGLAFQNLPDGLTGLSWHRRSGGSGTWRLMRVVLEVLNTTNQSGDTFDVARQFQGRDNYFNHGQYVQGWSYQGRTIGTPFIAPRSTFSAEVNANEGGGYFANNRVLMAYAGAQVLVGKTLALTGRVAWSRNFGTYDQVFAMPYHQTSALLSGGGRLFRRPNLWLTASVALDRGQLYPNAVGGFVSLQKRW